MREPVLVVSGVPRSGTSLAMALLQAAGVPLLEDAHRPPDAGNPRGYHEYEPVKRLPRDAGWLATAGGHAVKVIHALLPALPEGPAYRVVLMDRDLREVVVSQDRLLAQRGALRPAIGSERLVARLAWELEATRAWLDARGIAWLALDYAGLVEDPMAALPALVAFAGLQVPLTTLAREVRPELRRVRFSGAQEARTAAEAAWPSPPTDRVR